MRVLESEGLGDSPLLIHFLEKSGAKTSYLYKSGLKIKYIKILLLLHFCKSGFAQLLQKLIS